MIETAITVTAVAIIAIMVLLWSRIIHWSRRAETLEAELKAARVRQKADILAGKLKAAWAAKTLADTDLVGNETTVTNTRPEGSAA